MHLIGFVIRIYHDARSSECQNIFKIYESAKLVNIVSGLNLYYQSLRTELKVLFIHIFK